MRRQPQTSPAEMTAFLAGLRRRRLASRERARLALTVWKAVLHATDGRTPEPAACSGPDGQIFFSWNHGRHHLEVEFTEDDVAEWFYRDRETEAVWGEDCGAEITPKVLDLLALFGEAP